MKINKIIHVLAVVVLSLSLLSGCASTKDVSYGRSTLKDPLETLNRAVFSFNDMLDRFLIEPAAKAYKFVTPVVVQNSIQSFMHNLREPWVVVNNLLQGDLGGAGVSAARFVMNSTLGVGGLADIASSQGLTYEDEDFGQTLAVWGFGDGFYLVLPIIGPSSLRDTAGLAVDVLADPVRIAAQDPNDEWIYYTRNAVEGIDKRARYLGAVEDMRRNSVDYYAAVRSAYVQRRHGLIHGGKTARAEASYDDFDAQ